ncbi:MAG TPA: SelB C-terminal domain-containing protein, partial [Actinomycetota bacterium]|nr:SelB C-terminal domain-containing protein [Actinomycetota bacterium]
GEAMVRLSATHPVVVDVGDRFVLREAGRRETVAGGVVLDPHPPRRWDAEHEAALADRRAATDRVGVALVLLRERRFVRSHDVPVLTGAPADHVERGGGIRIGPWLADPGAVDGAAGRLTATLEAFHRDHPLRPGLDAGEARAAMATAEPALADGALAEAVLDRLAATGAIARAGTAVRLPTHAASTSGREDADRLIEAVRAGGSSPPSVRALAQQGFGRDLVDAACADGRLVKVSPDIVVTPGLIAQAEGVVRASGPAGITVSDFRQALGTSRKYALPLLEYFDARGLTLRRGDVRLLRN